MAEGLNFRQEAYVAALSRPADSADRIALAGRRLKSVNGLRRPAGVLVVEDEAVIAEDLAEWLRDLGYRVRGPARSAREAIEILDREKIDIVLMDISLNGRIEGIEASIEIRRRFRIPVIYLSGCSSPEVLASVVCSRSHGLVSKPYDPPYLARVIARALQGPGAMAGAEP